jgi:hypothetical protein
MEGDFASKADLPQKVAAPMFRFSIRDVLWLTVVVGLGVGWYLDNARLIAVNAELARRDAETRFAKLRALELSGKAIIDADPL